MRFRLNPTVGFEEQPYSKFCSIGDVVGTVVGGISDIFGGAGNAISSAVGGLSDIFGSGSGSSVAGNTSSGGFLTPALLSAGSNALSSYFSSANQAAAAQNATAAQLDMFGQTQTNLLPFIQTGQAASSALTSLAGLNTKNPLTSTLLQQPMANLSIQDLQNTPGYQFNLNQGLQSAQNSFAARGLATSGAAVRGAEDYATGLAYSTYQQQYGNEVTNQTNQFNRLLALAGLGQTSSANLGGYSTQTASNIGSNIIGAANAGSAAISNAGTSVGNALTLPYMANALQGMYGNSNG